MRWTRTTRRSAAAAVLGCRAGGRRPPRSPAAPRRPPVTARRATPTSASPGAGTGRRPQRRAVLGRRVPAGRLHRPDGEAQQRNAIDLWASIDGRRFVVHARLRHGQPDADAAACGQPHAARQLPAGGRLLPRRRGLPGPALDAGASTSGRPARPEAGRVRRRLDHRRRHEQPARRDRLRVRGRRAARRDHTQIAIGGMCLAETADGCWGHERRYGSRPARRAPPQWDFSRYAADAVVINLGTNDKSHGVSGADFQAKYTAFLQESARSTRTPRSWPAHVHRPLRRRDRRRRCRRATPRVTRTCTTWTPPAGCRRPD